MKEIDEFVAGQARSLASRWTPLLLDPDTGWPQRASIGSVSRRQLEDQFPEILSLATRWLAWAQANEVELATTKRQMRGGVTQTIPTHVVIPDLATALRISGPDLEQRWGRDTARLRGLTKTFGATIELTVLADVVRSADGYLDRDFEILARVGEWFLANVPDGRAPTQLQIVGMDTKWLTAGRRKLALRLTHLDDLGLVRGRPPRAHFQYLDPVYRQSGGRRFDVATLGDINQPAYLPDLVLISENLDTAQSFGLIERGIIFEGEGFAGARTISQLDWVKGCPDVVYWGDMDAAGLEIVNRYRQAGIAMRTILMDLDSYWTFEQYGVGYDAAGRPLAEPLKLNLAELTEAEWALYDVLCDPARRKSPRIEQERIPLDVAMTAVLDGRPLARLPRGPFRGLAQPEKMSE